MFLAGWERSEGLSPTWGGSVERRGAGDPPSRSSALDLELGRLLGLGGEAALPSSSLAVQIRACSPDALPLHASSTRWGHAPPEPLHTRCGADKTLRLVRSPVRAKKNQWRGASHTQLWARKGPDHPEQAAGEERDGLQRNSEEKSLPGSQPAAAECAPCLPRQAEPASPAARGSCPRVQAGIARHLLPLSCLSRPGCARCCSHRRAMPARDAAMQGLGHRRVLRFCSWTRPSPCLQALGER